MIEATINFRRLWIGQTISQFGSMLGALGLLALLTLAATPAQMGTLEMLRALPELLVGLFAGAWVDRQRRRPFLIWTNLGQFGLLALVVFWALRGELRLSWLFAVAFLVGTLAVLFNTAYRAYLPTIVPRERLTAANSKLSVTESIAEIGAPGIGGVLVTIISPPLTLLVDALTFLAAAVFIGRIDAPEPAPAQLDENVWRTIRAGLRFVWRERPLRLLTIALALRNFFGGFFAALYALYVLRDVGLSPAWLGVLVGAGGIGALIGAMLVGRIAARFGLLPTIGITLLLKGPVGWLVPIAGELTTRWAIGLLFINQLLGDIGMAILMITALTLLQTRTPDALLGRVNASFTFFTGGVGTAGIFLGGLTGQWLGAQAALTVAVLALTAVGIWFAAVINNG